MSETPVFLTVDVESDCPPFLDTSRGIDEGLPMLRHFLAEEQIRRTMFVTGEVARRYPRLIDSVGLQLLFER